jgi:class 3 adenylate cyclase
VRSAAHPYALGAYRAVPRTSRRKSIVVNAALLSAPVSPSVSATPPVQAPEVAGERRHLTILFCDLVGSVTLTGQLDPEEWRTTMAGYQRAAAEAITRFEGQVARYAAAVLTTISAMPTCMTPVVSYFN